MRTTTITTIVLALAFALVPVAGAEGGEGTLVERRGAVAAIDEASISVRGEEGVLTCSRGERSPSLAGVVAGAKVAILCKRVEDATVLVALKPLAAETPHAGLKGRVAELSDTGIVVQGESSRLACKLGEGSPDTGRLRLGDRIAMLCSTGTPPLLTAWKRLGEGEEMRVVDIAGVVAEGEPGTITVVNRERDRSLTCDVPAPLAPLVEELAVGDRVKLLCSKRAGGTLTLLKLRRWEAPAKPALEEKAGKGEAGDGFTKRVLACKVGRAELAAAAAQLASGAGAVIVCRDGFVLRLGPEDGEAPKEAPKDEPKEAPKEAPKPAPAELLFKGVIASLDGGRIVVDTESGPRTCLVPETLAQAVAARGVGLRVKVLCKGTDAEHPTLVALAPLD